MADGRFSLDDILNEYPKKNSSHSENDVKLDSIIDSYGSKKSHEAESTKDSGTVKSTGQTVKELLTKPIELSFSEKDKKQQEQFENKYSKLAAAEISTKDIPDEELPPKSGIRKNALSFSEGFDDLAKKDDGYVPLIRKAPEKITPEGSYKKEKTGLFSILNTDISLSGKNEDKYSSAFDNYSSKNDIDINSILNEYASKEVREKTNRQPAKPEYTSPLKGLTDVFSKIGKKQDDEQHEPVKKHEKSERNSVLDGNTELLDGMMKIKKDRSSRTSHIQPIERKSISDIDLKIKDKILPDTTQIPVTDEQAEIDKINALAERRNRKVNDFVFVGDEEDVEEDTAGEEPIEQRVIDDFDNYEDAPSIANDIIQLKKTLVIRFFVLLACFAVTVYLALMNDYDKLPMIDFLNKRTETTSFLFANSVIGLIAAFVSYTVISCGLSKLIRFKADGDSLTAVATVTSIISSMIMLANTNLIKGSIVHNYIPVAIGALLFNTVGKLLIVTRTQRNFKYVSGSSEKYAVVTVDDEAKAQGFTRGALNDFPSLAVMKKTEFIKEFLKTSYAADSTDGFCKIFTPIIIGVALIIAIIASLSAKTEYGASEIYIAISVFVGCISICSSFGMLLVVNLPMEKASKKYAEVNGSILGYESIEHFSETNSVMIDAAQLFPQGSVKLSAIKVFSDTRIDEAIVEAASLTHQSNSILKNMFYDIIAGKTEMLNPVESYIFEDSMGLCGWINNKRILLGNRELMTNHSIEGMPSEAKEKDYSDNGRIAIYLSISGELSAMFVIELCPTMEIRQSMSDLERSGVYVIIRSVDSCISINRLSEMYGISPEIFKILPFRSHADFEEVTSYCPEQTATLACTGTFAAMSSLVLGSKRLKGTITAGLGLQAVSIVLALLIFITMVLLKSFGELNVSIVLLYNFIFTVLLMVFQSFRKL